MKVIIKTLKNKRFDGLADQHGNTSRYLETKRLLCLTTRLYQSVIH